MNLDQPVHQDGVCGIRKGPGQLSTGKGVSVLISLFKAINGIFSMRKIKL